jgi:hypothetical protein
MNDSPFSAEWRIHAVANDSRMPIEPRLLRLGIACTVAILVAHHPVADARQADGSQPPALVTFATAGAAPNAAAPAGDGATTLASLREDSNVSMLRIGHSAPEAVLQASAFSLALSPAPGHALDFRNLERTDYPNGMVSLYARDPATDTETAIVIDGLDVLGRMHDGEGNTWRLTPLGGGLTAVYRYDTSNFRMHPPGWDPGEGLDMDTAPREPTPEDTGSGADSGDVIDVMVVYTRRARMHVGNIDAFIQQALDSARRHYENSNIPFRLRPVHAYETTYVESGDIRADLIALGAPSDGQMDEAHALRDRYGADLVHLFVYYQTLPGTRERTCGVATYAHLASLAHLAGGATDVDCEQSNGNTFTHEVGHNLGAAHDRPNVGPPYSGPAAFPYGFGYCHPSRRWATVMAYTYSNNNCTRYIPYFSSSHSSVRFEGVPTGSATTDNRRVLLQTARTVANHRQSRTQPSSAHTLPMVPPASNLEQQGFVRIINNSDRAGEVTITAIDDRGRRFGPVMLSLGARKAAHFNSRDLESGNSGKGLSGRTGDGYGNWRLELSTDLEIEHLAYVRTSDGFVTNMHEVAAEIPEGSNRYHVPFLNPGKNRNQESKLRLINPGSSTASIEITGVDDDGRPPPRGPVHLDLGAGMARILTAYQLENGGSGLTGSLGAGQGKWRLSVSADRPIQVMSLLELPTGHLTNLSRGQEGVAPPPPPPPGQPDLVVQSPMVDDDSLTPGQAFLFSATVRNQGGVQAVLTRLRVYRSTDATITTSDAPVAWAPVDPIPASGSEEKRFRGLSAPSASGTYYYGACVDAVSGESNTGNNCSSAVRVTVSAPSVVWGAWAVGFQGGCGDGFGWRSALNQPDAASATSLAVSRCRSAGLQRCAWVARFRQCGAVAFGRSSAGCAALYGGFGPTRSAAEQDAVSRCGADYSSCRVPADSVSGVKASTCNAGFGRASPTEREGEARRSVELRDGEPPGLRP